MKSLYACYIYEIEKIETVETDKYFFNYKMVENEFHVYEVYVLPEHRSSSVSIEMADRIESLAAAYGARYLVGFVHKAHHGWEISLAFQKKRGLRILLEDDQKITLIKEVPSVQDRQVRQ